MDDLRDTGEDLDPAVIACQSIDEWVTASERNPGAIAEFVDPRDFLGNRCAFGDDLASTSSCIEYISKCETGRELAGSIGCLALVQAGFIAESRLPEGEEERAEAPLEGDEGIVAPAVLLSPAFIDERRIPVRHTCAGADLSPELTWWPAPEGTESFVVWMVDEPIGLRHWTIWDVPGGATSLAEGVERVAEPGGVPGAKQLVSFDGTTRGYLGPCPPDEHEYVFYIAALPVAELPEVGLESSVEEIDALVEELALRWILGRVESLTGFYGP